SSRPDKILSASPPGSPRRFTMAFTEELPESGRVFASRCSAHERLLCGLRPCDGLRASAGSPKGARTMHYDFIAIPDADVPQAVDPVFQHVVITYASEANKTVSMWRAIPDSLLDFQPHEKTNPIRTILIHQLLSERRFFAQFVGTQEPAVEELLPPGEKPVVQAYIEKYVGLAKGRLPQL